MATARRTTLAGLIPLDFEVIALSDSTAVGFNSTIRAGAAVVDISVETQPVRYRSDGTDPTLTTGVVLQKDTHYRFEGYDGSAALKFQRTTGTASVSVMAYSVDPGGDR